MRRIFSLAILMMACSALMAQPKPNSFFAGGNFSFYTGKDKSKDGGTSTVNDTYTNFSVYPKVGYFLSDKFAVGAQIGGSINVSKQPNSYNNTKSTRTGFSFEPFARYYVVNQKFGIFGEASMGFGLGTTKYTYDYLPTEKTTYQAFSLGVSPGIYYSLSDHLMLESKVGWLGFTSETDKNEDGSSDINNEFGLNLNPSSISLGFTWVF
jgi:outer membrane protein